MSITNAHIRRVARAVRNELLSSSEACADEINKAREGAGLPPVDAKAARHPRLTLRYGYGEDPNEPEYHQHIDWCAIDGSIPTVEEVLKLANDPRQRVRWIEIEGWPRVRVTCEITGRRRDDADFHTDYGSCAKTVWIEDC